MVAHLSVLCQMLPRLTNFVLEVCDLFVEACLCGCRVGEILINRTELVIDRLNYADVGVGDGCGVGTDSVRTRFVFWNEVYLDVISKQ